MVVDANWVFIVWPKIRDEHRNVVDIRRINTRLLQVDMKSGE